jgi:hypothetical protein
MNAIDSTAPQSSEPHKVENGSCADETLLRRPRMPQEVVSNTSEPIIWPDGKTTQIPYSIPVVPCGRLGEAFVHEQRQIILEVKGQALVLPIVPEIIVGRKCSTPQATVPGVDLSAFDAFQQGVSRLHVRFSRAHDLIYVTLAGMRSSSAFRLQSWSITWTCSASVESSASNSARARTRQRSKLRFCWTQSRYPLRYSLIGT